MKFLNLLIATSLLIYSPPSLAINPIKSIACIAALNEIAVTTSYQKTSSVYTLNTLKAFRESTLGVSEIQGDIPEGFASSQNGSRLNINQVAARVVGIEEFTRTKDKNSQGEINFRKEMVIVGEDNISLFLDNYKNFISHASKESTRNVLNAYKWVLLASTLLLSNINWSKLLEPNELTYAAFAGLVVIIGFIWGMDIFVKRPFYKDYKMNSDLDKMHTLLKSSHQNYWGILSRNSNINDQVLTKIKRGLKNNDDVLRHAISQSILEAPSTREKLEVYLLAKSIGKDAFKFQWVGLDFYLEKKEQMDPELHVIVRGSEQRPVFPKISKAKNNRYENWNLQDLPELQPIPIKN